MAVIDELRTVAERMNADPEPIRSFQHVYQFDLSESGSFQVKFRDGRVEVSEGTPDTPECTLILSDANFEKLLRDDLNTTMAFMLGSLKVEGKLGLALKLQEALKHYSN
ncbi:SCP2 sterol-binding domain-containing protein [Cohnella pontilimi]|uniref:SCP2 sterol-binding domain-containing protein n=1 Tax=Cohnella pontilimi TaxID=2564100 RepID=A0A4U0FDH3_9BACL|nr:SCP2 sterol-binding domain-containing protein [Cohnella pontilimi]TJY42830.1 SCP2 sterol-binding domain-containing protein [Cohnella pontilimi]